MNYRINSVFFILILISSLSFASEKSLTEDREIKTISIDTKEIEGKLKAGVVIGYPFGITAGYRSSNFFELNGTIGSNYDDFVIGLNGLFTVVNFKISHEKFPLSVGPAVYSYFEHHEDDSKNRDERDEYTKIDLLGVARMEYDFKEIPLNLFIEAGFGLQLIRFVDCAGSFGVGVRYIF